MIIHGGYARFLREENLLFYNDIDLFATLDDLDNLCGLLSEENYVCRRGKTPVPNREVILLLPRDKNLRIIKFDVEVVSKSFHDIVWNLPDTINTSFMGLDIGIVSELTDMIIKEEVMDVSDYKHTIDVLAYRDSLGSIDTTSHESFRSAWETHIAIKYGPKNARHT
jgi:hypothetical protein